MVQQATSSLALSESERRAHDASLRISLVLLVMLLVPVVHECSYTARQVVEFEPSIGQYVGHPLNHHDLRFKSTLSTPLALLYTWPVSSVTRCQNKSTRCSCINQISAHPIVSPFKRTLSSSLLNHHWFI